VNTFAAAEGSSRVGVNSNFHSNVTGKDGGEASSKESNSSVSKVSSWVEELLISIGVWLKSFSVFSGVLSMPSLLKMSILATKNTSHRLFKKKRIEETKLLHILRKKLKQKLKKLSKPAIS
jgi:hypothetical protein